MNFTDLFIKRPVLACVVSLLVLLVGMNAFQQLKIREYPEIEDAVININTPYPGASADLVQGFITTPTQQAIASAEGIAYITSSSTSGMSTVSAHIAPGHNSDKVLTEIIAKAAEIRGELPDGSKDPIITKSRSAGSSMMYLDFNNPNMNVEQITDYLQRVVQPQLATLDGVGDVKVYGSRIFAMRVWLDPDRMASRNITASEVVDALRRNNFLSTAGEVRGEFVVTEVKANTDLQSAEEFQNIVVRSDGDSLVRIRDIGTAELSAESFDTSSYSGKEPTVIIALSATPGANPLDVARLVRKEIVTIREQAPEGMEAKINFDASEFIEASIKEVVTTLLEASLIVILVVFLFLGQLRSVIIPVVAIPLSLIGTLFLIWSLDYSINLLTLLALVLSIGLVVDDAIVVVENIHRHIEEGLNPFKAAIIGAREIAMPVISMTLTLAAVYAPLGFLTGTTGTLFREFAFTLAGAVIISGLIALTLSPMMCAKFLQRTGSKGLAKKIDQNFEWLISKYRALLSEVINYRLVTLVFACLILLAIPLLLLFSQSELAPEEDSGFLFHITRAPDYASLEYVEKNTRHFASILDEFPEHRGSFLLNSASAAGMTMGGVLLKNWDERERSVFEIQPILQQKVDQLPGIRTFFIVPSTLPGNDGGVPVQIVIKTISDYRLLSQVTDSLLKEARNSGLFMFIDSDLKFSKPELRVSIDRDKAAQLGVSMDEIGSTLAVLLGDAEINRFSLQGRSYKVIPQVFDAARHDDSWLGRYHVRTLTGEQVPLSTIISVDTQVQPSSLNQFQQLNSAKLEGMPMPGVTLGDVVKFFEDKAKEILPEGFLLDYDGQTRQFIEEGNTLMVTFLVSLIAIYLVLSAQFESFRDPFVILISVPLSICGALIPIALGFATLNIYSEIGLITLIGLITKHGILIVEFANRLQLAGHSIKEAAVEAAAVRLRPILMTTAAMVLGVFPLILAAGAGAESRFNIGLVIATGMTVGTAFTLFVVPVFYSYLARRHSAEDEDGEAVPA